MSRRRRLNTARRRIVRFQLAKRDGTNCFFCAVPFAEDLVDATIDHLIPYRRYPRNLQENLVLACETCNVAKGSQSPEEFLRVDVEELAAHCGRPVADVTKVLQAPATVAANTRYRVLTALRSMAAQRLTASPPRPLGHLTDWSTAHVDQMVADHTEGLAGHLPGRLAHHRAALGCGDGPQGHGHGPARHAFRADVPVSPVRPSC